MNFDKLNPRQKLIIEILSNTKLWTKTEALINACKRQSIKTSDVTLKRDIAKLVSENFILKQGHGRATEYKINSHLKFTVPINEENYLSEEPDKRRAQKKFNFEIFEQLSKIEIFSTKELSNLHKLNKEFQRQKKKLSPTLLRKEYERLTIELSWKSSALEGNTYSLLDTENLLKEGIVATGKKAEETQMLLNHKEALDYIVQNQKTFSKLTTSKIEEIHRRLMKDLDVSFHIRKRIVRITGTAFHPIDNEYQIKEALESYCNLINKTQDVFVKAFLTLILISYIQPFEDGNKRTSRLATNAVLLAHNAFPFSYRSIDILEYKKAILLFYELNYLPAIKKLFIEQAEFAAKNYFQSEG